MAAHQADNEDVDMDAVLEDHTPCQQRITHLEGLLASKDAAIKTEQDKIQAYTGTIKLLRDELHKQGAIRGSISDRLQQLGLSVVSTAAGASSSTTVDVRSRSTLPPLGFFSGNRQKDQQSFGDFMANFMRRYEACTNEIRVRDLGQYLTGGPLREYKNVLSERPGIGFSELRDALRARLSDNTDLAKTKRRHNVASLRIREGQSYSQFVSLLESRVAEAYEDTNPEFVAMLKHDCLRNSIREADLLMSLETALETVKSFEDKFAMLKRMTLTYEQKAQSIAQFQQGNTRSHKGVSFAPSGSQPSPSTAAAAPQGTQQSMRKDQPAPKVTPQAPASPQTNSNFVPLGTKVKFGNKRTFVCTFCNREGHTDDRCYDKNPSLRPKGNAKKASASTVIATNGVVLGKALSVSAGTVAVENPNVLGAQAVSEILFNGHKVNALFDCGSMVNIVRSSLYKSLLQSSNSAQLKCFELPAVLGQPKDLIVQNASGHAMSFRGRVMCELRLSGSDSECERYMFLVQDDAPQEVILGTPVLFKSDKFWSRLNRIRKPQHKVEEAAACSSTAFSMRIAAKSSEWSEVRVKHGCYIGPGNTREVVLKCANQSTAFAFFGEKELGNSSAFVASNRKGHIVVPVVNQSTASLSFKKGMLLGRVCPVSDTVMDSDNLEDPSVSCNVASAESNAKERAAQIYAKVVANSTDKSVLPESSDRARELFERFNDCFALSDLELGTTSLYEHDIVVKDEKGLPRMAGRPVPLGYRKPLAEMLSTYLTMQVISHSSSEYSSPVVLVRKKDGSLRMCIDYRKLNRAIKLSQWPMPNIDVMLQSLAGKKFFTTCDLHSGYWQIPLTEQAKELTAFSTMGGHYHFNVLPFGLSTAPGQFERAMEKLFAEDLGKTVYIYLDDILIATDSLEEHFEVLERVFQKLREYNLRLKPSKCSFLTTETEFLGHVISSDGLKTDQAKIAKILDFPVPQSPTDVRSFLGICNYYRKFVRNFSQKSKPLRDVTRADGWQWTDREQNSFDEMKQVMTSPPVLIQPDIESAMNGSRPFLLYTDASKDGVGAVLSQLGSDGKEHPIAFASKCTSSAESKYAISDLEALALVYALRKFKYFVANAHIVVRTDHHPLVYLFKQTNLSNRLLRWADEIQPYCNDDKLKIEYIKGKSNCVADSLSRNCVPESRDNTLHTRATADIMSVTVPGNWLECLRSEDWLQSVFASDADAQDGALSDLRLKLDDVCLKKVMSNGRTVPVVPAVKTREVYDQYHSGLFGGHSGWYKTVKLMENFDIGGTLLDFNGPCDAHKRLPLSAVMPITTVPPCADVWFAKDPYELAQGLEIAESLQVTSATRALFFGNNSPLASFSAYAKPSEASLVRVMSKLADVCPARRQAFAEAAFKQLTCSSLGGSDQSALKVLVAERVRASLDGKKSLCNDPVVVLGGQNAHVLSEVIGGTYVELPTVPDLRLYLESTHFQASVGYVYVWLDIFHESFQLAEQSQLVPALRAAVVSAAKWSHVHFVVLPVPYTASLLPVFEHFMQEFNKTELKQPNVLWFNDSERFDGARFAFSLGCNQLITDFTVVTKMGHVRRRAARAALRFIRGLKPHFVPGHVDLTDPPKEEPSTSSVAHHDVASSSELHGVRRGSVHKPTRGNYGNYSARGGPSKPGGGGGRGKWNKEQRGQGRR